MLQTSRLARNLPPLILVLLLSVLAPAAHAATEVTLYPIPTEVRSTHYTVSINGHRTPVVHAASKYYLLNFDTSGPVTVSVTADDPHFWDAGVEIQPMRFGIRPVRHGATLTFPLVGPAKLSISRPNDHFAEADMLFLFANEPDTSRIGPGTPGVRYYGPGVHQGSIDAQSGDTIYLAGGAVIFGSLNIWQVHDVHVLGRGMIIYDGPQNPGDDDGWMHKRNWHAIVMDNAHNIEIDGITTVVRSRTWQIQMKDSRNIGFYNVKVVAGAPADANQDGMDWLGGGDTTVRNSFFRASDDVFALQGNWEGYGDALKIPGNDVTNISIENTVASTSISNTIRVAWPEKTFSSAHFSMRDMDVIHTGYGDCKVPFAFFELWADPNGHGTHSDYRFDNIRLEDWYSLYQIRYPQPSVRDVHFTNIWAMDAPGMVPPALLGDVRGVTTQDVPDTPGQPTQVLEDAAPAQTSPPALDAGYTYTTGVLRPRQPVAFTAAAPDVSGRGFHWLFGDGATAEGRSVTHAFPDAQGTLLDNSGRFRVLLHITDASGAQSWSSQSVVVSAQPLQPFATNTVTGSSPAAGSGRDNIFNVAADGGYTLTVLTTSQVRVTLDDRPPVTSPVPRARVCGSAESATQPLRISAALLAGRHRLRVEAVPAPPGAEAPASTPAPTPELIPALAPRVLWEASGLPRQPMLFEAQ